jgi:VWFA-related protein
LTPKLTLVLFLTLLIPTLGVAQDPSQPSQTFTSNSELVMVPVQVLDHWGRPVHGLKKEDFVLKSDGNPQPIAIFDEVHVAAAPPAVPAPPPLLAAVPPPPTPVRFTNLPATGIPQQLVILAVDTVNTPMRLQGWAREQTIRYLQANPPRQPIELVALTPGGVRQLHPFTTDAAALVAALRRMHTGLTRGDDQAPLLSRMDRTGGIDTYASMVNELQERQTEEAAAGANATYATLHDFEEIAWAYSAVPGRKTVMWLTTGFPIQQMVPDGPAMIGHGLTASSVIPRSSGMHISNELLPAFQRAFTALNRSNVVIYPVDVQGLPMDDMWDITMPSSLYIHPELSHLTPTILADRAAEDRDGMKELAHRTGGKTCTAGNNVSLCLQEALAESSDYYLLGFYVSRQKRRIGWHKLKVNLNVDQGEVRARNSYYLRTLGEPPQREQEEDLRGAINASVDYTGILFNVQAGARPDNPKAPIIFKVSVPSTSILLLPGENKLSFDVISIPLSKNGMPVDKQSRMVKIEMNPETAQKALQIGWNLTNSISADGAPTAVKVVIRDNGTGRIGSVTFPVEARVGS